MAVYAVDILYTCNGGGRVSLTLDGERELAAIDLPSTYDDREPDAP